MAKKDFKGGLSSLLGDTPIKKEEQNNKDLEVKKVQKKGRPKTVTKTITKTSQNGTKNGETRATFIVKEEQLDKLKALAYWERIQIKEVIHNVIEKYLEDYERENGEIKSIKSKK